MKIFGTRARITFGLVCIIVSVLLLAILLNVLPDRRRDVLDGRGALCESVAVNASVLVTRHDLGRLETILKTLVKRKDTILSAAVRSADGELLVEVADHRAHWEPLSEERSTETQVQVPIWAGKKKWGIVEVRFTPLDPPGPIAFIADPHVRLIVFVASACYLLIYFYLVRMLRHLDPSKAVPGHVRSAFDTLAEGLLILDKQGRIVLANDSLATILGRAPKRLLGLKASELPWAVDDEGRSEVSHPWEQVLEGAASSSKAMMVLGVGKDRRTFMTNCSSIPGHDGRLRGVLVSLDDVTKFQRQEIELRKSKAVADAANRAKSEFLANMSHEIRTPMNAILGFADALRRGFAEDEQQRMHYLDTIHTSGKFLLELINDTLDLSKIEAGKLAVERIACSPHQLISEVVEVLGVRARECGLTLDYSTTGPIPETVQSDPTRLRQVLTNLAGNAIKFTKEGGVRLVARLLSATGPPKLAIDVIDTGIGIAADSRESVFDPFVQADSATTRQYGGTGLGLAISRRLAEALDGQLTVDSELGKGSTFTLTIDTGPLDGIELLDLTQLQQRSKPASQPAQNDIQALPSARVLVVDDGESNRQLIQLVLQRAGVQVETAENGQEAVERVTSGDFDIVLMDMQMPVMDGYAATARLRQLGETLPIIALTANAMQGDEEKCRAAGCSGFLGKPIDLDELMRTIAAELDFGRPVEPEQVGPGCRTGPESPSDKQVGRIANPSHSSRARRGSPDPAATTDRQVSPNPPETFGQGRCEVGRPAHSEVGRPAHSEVPSGSRDLQTPDKEAPAPTSAEARQQWGLPADDEAYRQIVERFIELLAEQLTEMCRAWNERDYTALAELAHSIKGAGGTLGFHEFTAPAAAIEESAKQRKPTGIKAAIAELAGLAESLLPAQTEPVSQVGPGCRTGPRDRRGSPDPAATLDRQVAPDPPETFDQAACEVGRPAHSEEEVGPGCRTGPESPSGKQVGRIANPSHDAGGKRPPVTSSLPLDDPEFRQIVVGFLPRLEERLGQMDAAWQRGDLAELAQMAHWLKGACGTVGFNAFTDPAKALEKQAKADEADEIEALLKEIRELADSIVVPSAEECVP